MRVVLLVSFLVSVTLAGCSEGASDVDGDSLRDGTEKGWPDLIVDYMDRRVRLTDVTSDTKDVDTDDDGLSDFDEFFQRSDPRNNDTDGDGLTDCQETVHRNQSECEDSNYSGAYDGGYQTNPLRADSDPGPGRYINREGVFVDETDTINGKIEWGDGISDGDEIRGYLVELGASRQRLVTSNPRALDSDGDHLEDGEELFLFGGDPEVQDTDGDGCQDGTDAFPSTEETYAIGLQTFDLKADMDSDGGSDLLLSIQIVGRTFASPPGGSMHVNRGETNIQALSPPPTRPAGCSILPYLPWVKLQIAAEDPDGLTSQPIDITSLTPAVNQGRSVPALWWNVREDRFSWDSEGKSTAEPLLLGVQASLALRPEVILPQGS